MRQLDSLWSRLRAAWGVCGTVIRMHHNIDAPCKTELCAFHVNFLALLVISPWHDKSPRSFLHEGNANFMLRPTWPGSFLNIFRCLSPSLTYLDISHMHHNQRICSIFPRKNLIKPKLVSGPLQLLLFGLLLMDVSHFGARSSEDNYT